MDARKISANGMPPAWGIPSLFRRLGFGSGRGSGVRPFRLVPSLAYSGLVPILGRGFLKRHGSSVHGGFFAEKGGKNPCFFPGMAPRLQSGVRYPCFDACTAPLLPAGGFCSGGCPMERSSAGQKTALE